MSNPPLYLLGAGGHGRVVLDALLKDGVSVTGILDPGLQPGQKVFDVPVLGADNWLDRVIPSEATLANGLGTCPRRRNRIEIFLRWRRIGFRFLTVCHPSAVLGRDSSFGEGSQIMAGAVLQCRVNVGENAVINTSASVDHDCYIGAHAFISPGATLCGEVRVDDEAFIGASAVILPGLQIGRGTVVGAGAVVIRSVGEGLLVAGNPAAMIGKISS